MNYVENKLNTPDAWMFLAGLALIFTFTSLAQASELKDDGEAHGLAISRVESKAPTPSPSADLCTLSYIKCDNEITAEVTAYNTVPEQTDSSPCEAAGGNICGRNDVVACPRSIPLGTRVVIAGKEYECLDRLSKKYDNRFDISFGMDKQAAKEWGRQTLDVLVLN